MGTNYYARIIPSKKRKKELHDAIEANDFSLIKKLVGEMYYSIEMDWGTDSIVGGEVHLGKRSGGWKFLWNPNVFVIRNGHSEWIDNPGGSRSSKWIPEPDTAKYLYPLTKEGIKAFIDREDIEIYDEYDEKQDKEEFWQMALDWGKDEDDAWDAAGYEAAYPNEHHWRCSSDLIDLLEREGYEFTSKSCSDFYSDGLRFATSTEFS